MFSENKKGQDQGSQPNRIEANTHIKGDISSQADFRIDGVLEGNLTTTGKVVIGASGKLLVMSLVFRQTLPEVLKEN
jgi:cytoskeletal protein CcmA (bactofilin family)